MNRADLLTEDKIQNFYQIIVNAAQHEVIEVSRAAKQLEKHYMLYLKHVFGNVVLNNLLVAAKKKALHAEIGMLVHYNILDAALAENIEADDFSAETLKTCIEEDERQDFLDRLDDMAKAANNAAASSPPKIVDAKKIKTGLSLQDKRSIVDAQISSVPTISTSEIFMRQIANLLIAEKFEEGISQLEAVIAAQETESFDASDDQNRAVINYKRMLARAYQSYGVHLQHQAKSQVLLDARENYERAIRYIITAIDMVKDIHKKGLADTTIDRQVYQKSLAHVYDVYGSVCRKQQDFEGAIKNINEAIKVVKKISLPLLMHDQINLFYLRRNLVYVTFLSAVSEMDSLKDNADEKLNPQIVCETAAKKINFCIRTASLLISKYPDLVSLTDLGASSDLSLLNNHHSSSPPGSPSSSIIGSTPGDQSQSIKKMETEILSYRIAFADINQKLTTFWCEQHNIINALNCCKNIIDALMPGHKAKELAVGHEALLVESNIMLRGLVLDYQLQHNLPRDEEMISGYKSAVDILNQHKNKQKAWTAITTGVFSYLTNKEVLLFGRVLLSSKNDPAKKPVLAEIAKSSYHP